ncbi:MAG: hypothetical protein JXA73_08800 [Acidobacteria bacterium]|nr:hypothetical protein [Acidobacteriota bacterium]
MQQELRRDELCDIALCHDSPGPGIRCRHCPLTKLDLAHHSAVGRILQRALNKRALMNAGIALSIEDIGADEMYALLIIEEEQKLFEEERSKHNGQQQI